ncbi:MAG: sigma-70 family RNA polymerase sigma factor, partial [Gammaproteobacteria bacterium]|nr:sigma-70 family RNA polymerase sigma factor [Gammaproteobacteria bacterium]
YFRSPTDAEDACQEVLTRVFRRIDQFEGRSGFRTWLYRVTENQCRTLLRKQRQRQERELTGQALPDVNMEPLDFVDNFETKALVDKVLARLPASDREVLALRFREDLSFDKMAQHLNLRLSAAKMRLYRAMDHFKQECIVFGYDRLTTIS